jgi:hypothetical protein
MATGMVAFAQYFSYPGLASELIINTVLIASFIVYAQYKDKVVTVFFRRSSA